MHLRPRIQLRVTVLLAEIFSPALRAENLKSMPRRLVRCTASIGGGKDELALVLAHRC